MLHGKNSGSSSMRPVRRKKKCVQKSYFLRQKKRAILSLSLVAPPPPQSMLEMCIRSRGLACRCYFPTLIGGAGGPPKVAILETGRNTTFGALLGTFGATNISAFVATALIWPPFWGGRHMTLPEACKTGIPDLGWLRAIFVRAASN